MSLVHVLRAMQNGSPHIVVNPDLSRVLADVTSSEDYRAWQDDRLVGSREIGTVEVPGETLACVLDDAKTGDRSEVAKGFLPNLQKLIKPVYQPRIPDPPTYGPDQQLHHPGG